MAEFSDYMENKIIEVMRATTFTAVAAYVALYTTDPTDADTGTEVSGGAYARQLAGLAVAAGGASSNAADITFPTAGASWGTVTHCALVDHETNVTWGTNVNVLMWSEFDASKVVGIGDTFKINATQLAVSVA